MIRIRKYGYAPGRDSGTLSGPTAWEILALNLRQQYGHKRAARILNGQDRAAHVDIAKWNAIGRKGQAA